jgi:hypothetical protein
MYISSHYDISQGALKSVLQHSYPVIKKRLVSPASIKGSRTTTVKLYVNTLYNTKIIRT